MEWPCFEAWWTSTWNYWRQNERWTNKREEKNPNATWFGKWWLHSDGQLRTERDGDTEKGCQNPAMQQKTTDDYTHLTQHFYTVACKHPASAIHKDFPQRGVGPAKRFGGPMKRFWSQKGFGIPQSGVGVPQRGLGHTKVSFLCIGPTCRPQHWRMKGGMRHRR